MKVGNVKKPPLKMVDHFFTRMHVEASTPDIEDLDSEKAFDFEIECEVDTRVNTNDEDLYQVVLDVTTSPKEGYLFAYKMDLQVIGLFRPAEDYEGEDPVSMIEMIGATLLYSAAREFVYTVTMRGPWPAVYLPTTSFIPAEE
jgi:preprotein translocase subunit SecB